VLQTAFGLDTIHGFTAGAGSEDRIQFRGVFDDFADLMASATQSGSDVVITDGANTLTLKNVTLAQLHQDDFSFVSGAGAPVSEPIEMRISAVGDEIVFLQEVEEFDQLLHGAGAERYMLSLSADGDVGYFPQPSEYQGSSGWLL
jgi:hypothetical protein